MQVTPLARPDLDDYIEAEIYSNQSEYITGDTLQRVLLYIAASAPNLLTDGDDTGTAPIPAGDSTELFRILAGKVDRSELLSALTSKQAAFVPFATGELNGDKGAFAGLQLRPLLKAAINALGTPASGPGAPGTFTGYVEEQITAFPFTSATTTSYANVLGLWLGSNSSVTGGKQRKPSADNSYAPDYTLNFDSAGHATAATVGTVPSPLPEGTCLLYTPGTATTTTTPTTPTPPAGGGGGTITVVGTTGSESITVVSTTGS